jgi:hypothetical protein
MRNFILPHDIHRKRVNEIRQKERMDEMLKEGEIIRKLDWDEIEKKFPLRLPEKFIKGGFEPVFEEYRKPLEIEVLTCFLI